MFNRMGMLELADPSKSSFIGENLLRVLNTSSLKKHVACHVINEALPTSVLTGKALAGGERLSSN